MASKEQRKELLQQYKEIRIEAGVYQIKNTVNGKVFLDTLSNLKSINGRTLMLEMGTHTNKELQADWNKCGRSAFLIEVLEVLKPSENEYVETKDELKRLKEVWLDKLQPYGERGYHKG